MSTYHCEFCGKGLKFRMIGGATVPLHPKGSVCEGKKFYRAENQNRCIPTKCPKCSKPVFFLRHNGGSVWLERLGWPWPKHPCIESSLLADPPWWDKFRDTKEARLAQIWIYGLLRGENGGAFWLSEHPRDKKPRLVGARLRRLMCPPGNREKLLKLQGQIVVKLNGEVILKDGTVLQDDGDYDSSLRWW